MEEKNTTVTRRNALLAGVGAAMSAAALAAAPTTAHAALSDSKVKVTLSATSFTYSGSAKKPTVTVKYGTKKLTCGTHKLTYSGTCKQVGYHFVNIVFIGSYSSLSTVHKSYKIIPKVAISSVKKYKSGVANIYTKISGSSYFYVPKSYTSEATFSSRYNEIVRYRLYGANSWSDTTFSDVPVNSSSTVCLNLKAGKKYQFCEYATIETNYTVSTLKGKIQPSVLKTLGVSNSSTWNKLTSTTTAKYTVTV